MTTPPESKPIETWFSCKHCGVATTNLHFCDECFAATEPVMVSCDVCGGDLVKVMPDEAEELAQKRQLCYTCEREKAEEANASMSPGGDRI